jgi:hypothetical protein
MAEKDEITLACGAQTNHETAQLIHQNQKAIASICGQLAVRGKPNLTGYLLRTTHFSQLIIH